MRNEESIKIVKFEHSRTNSVGNRLVFEVRFQKNPTFAEDLELYAQMLADASAELAKEIANHRDTPILEARRTN